MIMIIMTMIMIKVKFTIMIIMIYFNFLFIHLYYCTMLDDTEKKKISYWCIPHPLISSILQTLPFGSVHVTNNML